MWSFNICEVLRFSVDIGLMCSATSDHVVLGYCLDLDYTLSSCLGCIPPPSAQSSSHSRATVPCAGMETQTLGASALQDGAKYSSAHRGLQGWTEALHSVTMKG